MNSSYLQMAPAGYPIPFYGRDGVRIVGYDNERGKGDHKHLGAVETRYRFESVEKLVTDFLADVERATNEHDT